MINFLPQENKKQLQSEYRLRVTSVAGVFAVAIAIFTGLFLLPSNILSVSRGAVAQSNKQTIEKMQSSQGDKDVRAALTKVKSEVTLVQSTITTRLTSVLVAEVLSHKDTAITITGIRVDNQGQTGGAVSNGSPSISLDGSAATREALVTFSKSLESDPLFGSVAVPVSSFEKNANIPFSLTFSLKTK